MLKDQLNYDIIVCACVQSNNCMIICIVPSVCWEHSSIGHGTWNTYTDRGVIVIVNQGGIQLLT